MGGDVGFAVGKRDGCKVGNSVGKGVGWIVGGEKVGL